MKTGHNIKKLSVVDLYHQTRMHDLVGLINCCPNLTHFSVKGNWKHADLTYQRKSLPTFRCLTHFSYVPTLYDTNVLRVAARFVAHIIKNAPELKFLETHINQEMIDMSVGIFPDKLNVWSLHFIDPNLVNVLNFLVMSQLINNSNVKVIVVRGMEEYSMEELYKQYVRSTLCYHSYGQLLMSQLRHVIANICARSSLMVVAPDMDIDRQMLYKWNTNYGTDISSRVMRDSRRCRKT